MARHFVATTAAVVGGLIAAGGGVASAAIQSRAAGKSAKLQKEATDAALAYEKERDQYARATEANRYGAMMRGTAPYRRSGAAANTAMDQFLGLPETADPVGAYEPSTANDPRMDMPGYDQMTGVVTPGQHSRPSGRQNAPSAPQAAPGATPAMLTMRAPDGSTQAVPADQATHYEKLGAQVVR